MSQYVDVTMHVFVCTSVYVPAPFEREGRKKRQEQ